MVFLTAIEVKAWRSDYNWLFCKDDITYPLLLTLDWLICVRKEIPTEKIYIMFMVCCVFILLPVFYLNFLWNPSECPFRTSNTHNSYMISEFFTRPKHDFTRLGRVDGWLGRTLATGRNWLSWPHGLCPDLLGNQHAWLYCEMVYIDFYA